MRLLIAVAALLLPSPSHSEVQMEQPEEKIFVCRKDPEGAMTECVPFREFVKTIFEAGRQELLRAMPEKGRI